MNARGLTTRLTAVLIRSALLLSLPLLLASPAHAQWADLPQLQMPAGGIPQANVRGGRLPQTMAKNTTGRGVGTRYGLPPTATSSVDLNITAPGSTDPLSPPPAYEFPGGGGDGGGFPGGGDSGDGYGGDNGGFGGGSGGGSGEDPGNGGFGGGNGGGATYTGSDPTTRGNYNGEERGNYMWIECSCMSGGGWWYKVMCGTDWYLAGWNWAGTDERGNTLMTPKPGNNGTSCIPPGMPYTFDGTYLRYTGG